MLGYSGATGDFNGDDFDPDDPDVRRDSDGDGLTDNFEAAHGFDLSDGGEQTADTDGDGLDNLGERNAGTDPRAPDTDGLTDGFESDHGFDPLTPGEQTGDPDGDGLDNLSEQALGTNPNLADTDGDRFTDGVEIAAGSDPLDPLDVPLSGVPSLGPIGLCVLVLMLAAVPCWQLRRVRKRL